MQWMNKIIKRLLSENNGREASLAKIIEAYMDDLTLDYQQNKNLKALSKGAKVVIGGQQAGLFGGPLYTFHKIFSIITLVKNYRKITIHMLFLFLDCR